MENVPKKPAGPKSLEWHWFRMADMQPELLYDLLAFRESIFVVEQTCVYQELDGRDKTALHYLGLRDARVIACLRLLPPTVKETRVRIGRVAVASDWRKLGLAASMVRHAVEKARLEYPEAGVFLDAQCYLQAFYESLGFKVCGNAFLEDGIPHVPMEL
jgi:ElaA protein